MERARQEMRRQALIEFNFIKTCMLARELCLVICRDRVALDSKDIHRFCSFVANLCEEAGCMKNSSLCAQAAEAVIYNESQYLDLCQQSCAICQEGKVQSELGVDRPYIT